jgi:hypothetical protein
MTEQWKIDRLNDPINSDSDRDIMREVWEVYPNRDIEVQENPATGENEVWWFRTAVPDPNPVETNGMPIDENEIPISEARRDLDPETEIGDSCGTLMKWPE